MVKRLSMINQSRNILVKSAFGYHKHHSLNDKNQSSKKGEENENDESRFLTERTKNENMVLLK